MRGNKMKKLIIILGILSILLLAACQPVEKTVVVNQEQVEKFKTVSTSGRGQMEFSPDEVELMLTIESLGENAEQAQDINSKDSKRAIDALVAAGIPANDIETTNYNIRPEYDWTREERVFKGYRVTHTLKVTSSNVKKAGEYLDVAVSNGVNNVQNINFKLSDKALADAKEKVLDQAAKNARSKAQLLTKSLDVEIGSVRSISESSFDYVPYRASYDMAMVAEASVAPPIQTEDVSVSASVQVVYEIK